MNIKRLVLVIISRRNAEKVKTLLACLLYYSGIAWVQSSRKKQGGYIIMYHSVGGENVFWDNVIQTESFKRQVQWLSKHREIVQVQDFADRISKNMAIPETWVALTFDDGYRDNLSHALPVLESFGAPASFYVTWNVVCGAQEFFYDRIQTSILNTEKNSIQLTLDGSPFEAAIATRQQKLDCIQEVVLRIRNLGESQRAECVKQVEAQCLCSVSTVRDSYLDEAAVKQLSASSLVDIGSHTLSHPDLATCRPEVLQSELESSRENLQQLTGESIEGLAYPFGKITNYSEDVLRHSSQAGYRFALTTTYGDVRTDSDPFQLHRVGARDSLTRLKVNLMGISI